MAIRLLPYRQYDEQDVVNLFSYGDAPNGKPSVSSKADAGVLVKVSASDLSAPPVEYLSSHSLLGKTDYPHVARNGYPQVPLKVVAAGVDSDALGITLNQTCTHDENDENLLRYPQKKAELFAVTSGEAVPIATKGIFTFDEKAIASWEGTDGVVSDGVNVWAGAAADGKIAIVNDKPTHPVGKVLGAGKRTAQTEGDQFAGSGSAFYAVIKLDL
mgnify:CR=1 FL=1